MIILQKTALNWIKNKKVQFISETVRDKGNMLT